MSEQATAEPLSEVAKAIKAIREQRDLTVSDMAKILGVSSSEVSHLEHLSAIHGNIITPGIYDTFLTQVGVDLKKAVPALMVKIRRGKTRFFKNKSDMSVIMKKKDPIEMMGKAVEIVREANGLITNRFFNLDKGIAEREKEISEMKEAKKLLLQQSQEMLSKMIE